MFTIGREREKANAARYARTEADKAMIEEVLDAVHDLIEGKACSKDVGRSLTEAIANGGGGVWEQAGSWLRKVAREHPALHQHWIQLAGHKSPRVRFRVAAHLNEMPNDIRFEVACRFLADPSAKVRSKTAGEISMRPTPDLVPILQGCLANEKDNNVLRSIEYALNRNPR